jgi:DNA-binding CsgD family transcriptional regulator
MRIKPFRALMLYNCFTGIFASAEVDKMSTFDNEWLDFEPFQPSPNRSARQSKLPLDKEHRLTDLGQRVLAQLSPKEKCVARLLLVERSNKAIASKMGTSVETVKTHMAHMFHKVGVDDRLSLAMELIRHGVVPCPCMGGLECAQEGFAGS